LESVGEDTDDPPDRQGCLARRISPDSRSDLRSRDVEIFFSDPVFLEKFRKLDTVSSSEFHTYSVGDLVLPKISS
jgi:hypothetical protein